MPTNHFYMYVWAEDLTEKNYEDYDKWQFNAQGNWVINPKYEFTDVIALSWSDDFTLKSSKCTIDNSSYRTSVNKIAAEEGVAYDVDLQLGYTDKKILLTAEVYKYVDNPGRNSANIVGEYGHLEIKPSSVTVGFDSGKNISMSASLGTNLEMASPDSDNFTY